jgi:hypothetical protein
MKGTTIIGVCLAVGVSMGIIGGAIIGASKGHAGFGVAMGIPFAQHQV